MVRLTDTVVISRGFMNPRQAPGQAPPAGTFPAKVLLVRFDQAWQSGTAPSIPAFLALLTPTEARARRQCLEELVMIDLEYRWRQQAPQQRWRLEDYARTLPELGRPDAFSRELIGAEYRARRRWGDRPGHAEYLARFPTQASGLRATLAQVDAELAREFGPSVKAPEAQGKPAPPAGLPSSALITARPPAKVVAPASAAALVDILAQQPLLGRAQLEEVTQTLKLHFPEPRTLAGELLKRGWLTAYQVNQLLQGRGPGLVLGSYVLLERLGEGGIGQVFKARHAHMDRVVALKLMRPELVADAELVGRFTREIKVIARLDHPHIVRAYDAGPIGAAFFLAMEFVPGTDLSQLVKKQGPLPVVQACDYIHQAALGLQYAHEQGMVHRDIKPSNLLVTEKAEAGPARLVKVADLGLARLCRPDKAEAVGTGDKTEALTSPAAVMVMGTIDYMAPEQAVDFHGADIRADIYSLGCTFYYLLTGQPAYSGTTAQKMLKHQQGALPDIRQARPEVPATVADVLTRMLAKRPEDRYQTPGEVAAALAPLAGSTTPAVLASGRRFAAELLALGRQLGQFGLASWQALGRRAKIGVGVSLLLMFALLSGWWLISSTTPRSPLDQLELPAEQRSPGAPKELVSVLQVPPGPQRVAFSADGKLVACYRENTINLWDVRQKREWSVPGLEKTRVWGLAISPDSHTMFCTTENHNMQVWDLRDREPRKANVIGDNARPSLLAFSPDGKWLAGVSPNVGGGPSGLIYFARDDNNFQVRAKKPIEMVPKETSGVASLALAPDGKTLAVGLGEGDIYVWDPYWDPNTSLTVVRGRKDVPKDSTPLTSLDYSPDGKYLLSTDNQGSLIWDITQRNVRSPLKHEVPAISRFSKDGKHVLVWSTTTTALTAYDAKTGKKLNEWRSWPGKPAAWADDGRHVATSDGNGKVYILRIPGY